MSIADTIADWKMRNIMDDPCSYVRIGEPINVVLVKDIKNLIRKYFREGKPPNLQEAIDAKLLELYDESPENMPVIMQTLIAPELEEGMRDEENCQNRGS